MEPHGLEGITVIPRWRASSEQGWEEQISQHSEFQIDKKAKGGQEQAEETRWQRGHTWNFDLRHYSISSITVCSNFDNVFSVSGDGDFYGVLVRGEQLTVMLAVRSVEYLVACHRRLIGQCHDMIPRDYVSGAGPHRTDDPWWLARRGFSGEGLDHVTGRSTPGAVTGSHFNEVLGVRKKVLQPGRVLLAGDLNSVCSCFFVMTGPVPNLIAFHNLL